MKRKGINAPACIVAACVAAAAIAAAVVAAAAAAAAAAAVVVAAAAVVGRCSVQAVRAVPRGRVGWNLWLNYRY